MDAVATTGLTLLVGPANSGKMGRVLEWWKERRASRPLVVGPTGPDAQALSREMIGRAGALLGQSPALTFDGLVRVVLGRSPRYISALERSLLISWLIDGMQLRTQGLSSRLPGVDSAVGLLLEQLSESGRSPEELAGLLGRWAAADPGAAGLAHDITQVLTAYTGLRRDLGLTDRPEALRDAVPAVYGWARPVALYGFTSFTPGQRALIGALSERTEVLLVLSHDPARDVDLITPAEYAAWESMAATVIEVVPTARAYSSPAIAHLAEHFMSDTLPPKRPLAWSGAEGVRFLLASGQRNEAEMAAAHVAGLLRQGFPPGEIAVVLRHPQRWARLLGDVFSSCRIPYQMDHRRVLAETGLGHAFLSGLRGMLDDDGPALLAYLRSPYSGLSPDQSCDVELSYRRGSEKGASAVARIAEDVLPGSMDPLVVAVTAGSEGRWVDVRGAAKVARVMLVTGLRTSGPDAAEGEADARTFRALASALETMEKLGRALAAGNHRRGRGGEPPGLPFRSPKVLGLLAEMLVAGDGGRDDASVQVLSVHRARARRFGAMVVLGLTEGEFPGRTESPSLLTSAQRARLDAIGGGVLPPVFENEAALFASAVSRAWQVLVLSARDAEDGGGDATPSYFWIRAKEVLGVAEDDHERRTLADQHFGLETAPAPRHYLRTCAATGCEPHPGSGLSLTRPAASLGWRRPRRLVSSAALEELAHTVCFSPSALESYVRCPFSWFVDRVVGIDDLEPTVDERVVGGLLHQVLAATYQVLSSEGRLPLRAECVPRAEEIAFAAIERLVAGEDCPGSTAERRLTGGKLRRMARTLFSMEVHAAGGLVLSGTEVDVGGPDGVDIGGLRVRGRIDRIDRTAGGGSLFVYDYKSGHIPTSSECGTEEGLQLALYLLALAAEDPERTVSGGAYLSLRHGTRSGVVETGFPEALGPGFTGCRVLEKEDLDEVLRGAGEVARRAADGIRTGLIAPRTDRECAPWCKLGPVCRSRRAGYRR